MLDVFFLQLLGVIVAGVLSIVPPSMSFFAVVEGVAAGIAGIYILAP